jgi:diguanylate cyclase (GGDEF)-like protein
MSLPIFGLGALYVVTGAIIFSHWQDRVIGGLTVTAAIVTLARVALIRSYHRAGGSSQDIAQLKIWENQYAAGTIIFAALLTGLNIRVLVIHSPLLHLVAISLIFTFGAGTVSRISGRPLICVSGILVATVPTILGLAYHATTDDPFSLHTQMFTVEAILIAAVTGMSLETVRHLHRSSVEHLTTQHDLALMAQRDPLTDLPNRLLLRERFQGSIKTTKGSKTHLAVHYLDLDGFKAVNDVFGHPTGDVLLCEVARRLKAIVRSSDTVARLGGDEFIVVQEGVRHHSEAEMLARRIIRQLSAPYEIDGQTMTISASVGISIAPENGLDLDELMASADNALYRSKSSGKAQFHFYNAAPTDDIPRAAGGQG